MTDDHISEHVLTNGGLANIYPSQYERELGVALQKAQHEIEDLKRVATQASHCRQYMQHLGWCVRSTHINSKCICERDEDYAELMRLLDIVTEKRTFPST